MYDEPTIYDNPPHYYTFSGNANAFATKNPVSGCQNCDHVQWWQRPGCELGKLSCEAQAAASGSSNAVQTNLRNAAKRDPILGSANAVQNNLRGAYHKDMTNLGVIGKGFQDAGKSFLDALKSTADWGAGGLDIFGKYMPYFLAGGALIIVILLIKK